MFFIFCFFQIMPWRKTLLMSSWCECHPFMTTTVKVTQMVVGFTTNLNVSWKSMPRHLLKPLAINLALYHASDPLGFLLTQNIHLYPMMFCVGWGGISPSGVSQKYIKFFTHGLTPMTKFFRHGRVILVKMYKVFIRWWSDRWGSHPCFLN